MAERSQSLERLASRRGLAIDQLDIDGVGVFRLTPNEPAEVHDGHAFVYLHGGAYVYGGGRSGLGEASIIASRAGLAVIAVDYRMPPKYPFPAAVDDVVTVYRRLLKTYPATALAIGGTSAGGGLALAAVHRFKQLGLGVPGAIYAGTPWADLTKTGDSLYANEGLDRVLVTYDGPLGAAAELYAGGHDMTDPLISPVYGDFTGFPATYLVTGTRDLFSERHRAYAYPDACGWRNR